MAENVVVLEPGDERAQKIAKAMASGTAGEILQILAENSRSLTEITERLAIPLTTAKYHVENLLDAGLISVVDTRYSVKGREVKIYSLTNQLLIVAPRQSGVRSFLLKYASLFGIVLLGTLILSRIPIPLSGQGAITAAPSSVQRETGVFMMKAAYDTAPAIAGIPETALTFFCGGVLVIAILLCYELYLWKKRK